MSIIHISETLTLYRSDTIKPPNNWDAEHKNSLYVFKEMGPKNSAGFFFFTDSIDIAKSLGKKVKHSSYFLTETQTTTGITFIDFSTCINSYQMLGVLSDLGLNVLTDDFKIYEKSADGKIDLAITFKKWEPFFKEGTEISKRNIRIGSSTSSDTGYLGQRFTDFGNGHAFLNLIRKSELNLDGYRWRESEDQRGFTYCFFDSSKLSSPSTHEIKT
jgi:hypothetical protein